MYGTHHHHLCLWPSETLYNVVRQQNALQCIVTLTLVTVLLLTQSFHLYLLTLTQIHTHSHTVHTHTHHINTHTYTHAQTPLTSTHTHHRPPPNTHTHTTDAHTYYKHEHTTPKSTHWNSMTQVIGNSHDFPIPPAFLRAAEMRGCWTSVSEVILLRCCTRSLMLSTDILPASSSPDPDTTSAAEDSDPCDS